MPKDTPLFDMTVVSADDAASALQRGQAANAPASVASPPASALGAPPGGHHPGTGPVHLAGRRRPLARRVPHEYGDVTLPFVVLRRLDLVLKDKKDAVLEAYERFPRRALDPDQLEEVMMGQTGGTGFFNVSRFDLERLTADADNIEQNVHAYHGFSANVREILGHYRLGPIVEKLARENLLFLMVDKFTEVDLHPDRSRTTRWG